MELETHTNAAMDQDKLSDYIPQSADMSRAPSGSVSAVHSKDPSEERSKPELEGDGDHKEEQEGDDDVEDGDSYMDDGGVSADQTEKRMAHQYLRLALTRTSFFISLNPISRLRKRPPDSSKRSARKRNVLVRARMSRLARPHRTKNLAPPGMRWTSPRCAPNTHTLSLFPSHRLA